MQILLIHLQFPWQMSNWLESLCRKIGIWPQIICKNIFHSLLFYKMYYLTLGYVYVWDEITDSKRSQGGAFCRLKHLHNVINRKCIVVYSHICACQSGNVKLALMLTQIVQRVDNATNILDHKFLFSLRNGLVLFVIIVKRLRFGRGRNGNPKNQFQ